MAAQAAPPASSAPSGTGGSVEDDKDHFVIEFPDGYENSRIERTPFIDDIEKFMRDSPHRIDDVLRAMQERYQRYRLLETKLQLSSQNLSTKIPQIKQALDMVAFLIRKREEGSDKPIDLHYSLSDNLSAQARVTNPTKVGVWLGADVMVDFTLEEATELLNRNQSSAKLQLDLAYLRDQMSITEVNMARVWNFEVLQRKAKGGSGAPPAGPK